jgi:hypothetical protein
MAKRKGQTNQWPRERDKKTNNELQNTQRTTKNLETRTSQKNWG